MKPEPPKSFLWKFGLILIITQIVIAVGVGVFTYQRIRSFHLGQTQLELDRVGAALGDHYSAIMQSIEAGESTEQLQQTVRRDGVASSIRITLIRADGLVLADSVEDPSAMQNHRTPDRGEVMDAISSGQGMDIRYSSTLKQRMVYVARRLDSRANDSVILRTALSARVIDEEFARVGSVIALAALASVLVTLLIVVAVSRHYSRQISALARGAVRFSSGRLEHRIVEPPAYELRTLARALNRMAEQLGARMSELRQKQAELQTILQSMSAGVIALDREQRIFNINRAAERMLGVEGRPLHDRPFQDVVLQSDIHEFVERIMAGGEDRRIECSLLGDDPRRLQFTAELLNDGDDVPAGLLLVIEDITQIRRLEAMRTDFAANVSHELRTPITNIKGYVETLLDVGLSDPVRSEKFLGIVKQNADRLTSIIDDVLSLTRLEQPRVKETLERQITPVSGLIRSVVGQLTNTANAKSIRIQSIAPESLTVRVHAALMEQALSNLLSNAVKYSPAHTTVTVRAVAHESPAEIWIEVQDEGPGIAPHHLHRLFERFYRVDRGRSREMGGTGLGLAIVKHIVRAHGGRVEVESEFGSGSVFRLILPDSAEAPNLTQC